MVSLYEKLIGWMMVLGKILVFISDLHYRWLHLDQQCETNVYMNLSHYKECPGSYW